jgi:hypothetical protein
MGLVRASEVTDPTYYRLIPVDKDVVLLMGRDVDPSMEGDPLMDGDVT